MRSQKPIASLSLDLDNKWSYMQTHGDPGWDSFPSYLDSVVPRILDFLAERDLTITFFIVGQDAALTENHKAIRAIADAGHEIGNHSFSHEPWMHLHSRARVEEEIANTETQIARVTGQRTVGFRGPGYSLSAATLEVLAQRGYSYEASTLPTFFGPLARLYYFMSSNLSNEERKQRQSLFGSLLDGLRPLKPYRWGGDGLLEIPVTTMPILRSPIHISYVLYLSTISPALALSYFRTALVLCRMAGVPPSLLLHPLDFLGWDDGVGLEFFPAMNLSGKQKLAVVSRALEMFCKEFHVVCLREHAQRAATGLPTRVMARHVTDSIRY